MKNGEMILWCQQESKIFKFNGEQQVQIQTQINSKCTSRAISTLNPQLWFQEDVRHPAQVVPHRAEVPPGHVPDQDQEDPHGGGRGGVSLDVVFSWFAAQLNLVHVSLMSAVYHVQPKQQIKHSLLGYHSFNINEGKIFVFKWWIFLRSQARIIFIVYFIDKTSPNLSNHNLLAPRVW